MRAKPLRAPSATRELVLGLAGLTLAACAGTPRNELSTVAGPGVAGAPTSRYSGYKVGKPYQVKGVWYSPREEPNYDQIGIASWYGEQFHNQYTADGEVFDMTVPSAAHKTLPLPSLVEVTNLKNGKTVIVRVNDRGPFVDGRIIDMSKAAAAELGMVAAGVTQVRVRYVGRAPDPPGTISPESLTPPTQRLYKASNDRTDEARATKARRDALLDDSLPKRDRPRLGDPARAQTQDADRNRAEPMPYPGDRQPSQSFAAPVAPAPLPVTATHSAIAEVDSLFNAAMAAPTQSAAVLGAPAAAAQDVQAGVFATEAAAQQYASALTVDGLPEVQPLQQSGQTVWRVVVHGVSDPTQLAAARTF